jgi:hypothetical protein
VNYAERCNFAYSVAHGWALFKYRGGMPAAIERVVGWFWLAALSFPAGLLAPPGRRLLRGSIIVLAVAGISALAPGVTYHSTALLAQAGGFLLGIGATTSLPRRYSCVAHKHQRAPSGQTRKLTK